MKILNEKLEKYICFKKIWVFYTSNFRKRFYIWSYTSNQRREKNFELITDIMIDIYENKDKNNQLLKELDNTSLFMKKYFLLEDEIL